MSRIRPYLKTGETHTSSARQAMDGILGMLGFKADMYAVFEIWDRETRGLVKGCEAVAIHGDRLCVRVPSTVHRQELLYSKERILRRLNQAMGRVAISDIQFELEEKKGGVLRDKEPTGPARRPCGGSDIRNG